MSHEVGPSDSARDRDPPRIGDRRSLRLVGVSGSDEQGSDQPARAPRSRDLPRASADRTLLGDTRRIRTRRPAVRASGAESLEEVRQSARQSAQAGAREVARENLESAANRDLDPRDPRWTVALATARELQGPLLTFERRRSVLALAHRLGVRPFDANLIIAAVQDRARRGESLVDAMPTVALTAPAKPKRRWWPYAAVAGIAVAVHAWTIHALLFA